LEPKVKDNLPRFTDALLKALGQTEVQELTSVQGRFVLRERISGIMNDLVQKNKDDLPAVTNVYFSEFIVQ
ncbi:MAG: flagellar basal body-associated FliL family protein, partial [Proteobacteria bacterium]